MKEKLLELYRYRQLLYMIAYRDIKVKYKQSIMGFLWAILMPVLIIMAGVVVQYAFTLASHAQLEIENVASVAVKSLPWAFLVSSVRLGGNSLILGNRELVTKIYFPKEILPLAAVLSSLFDFAVASAALVVFLALVRVHLSLTLLWIPLLLLTLIALASGTSMVVATGSLFFRDVKYIVEVLLTFGIFFTPVFYDVRMFGNKEKWLLLNPVASLLEALSACVTRRPLPSFSWLAYSAGFAIVSLVGGYVFFKRLEPAFAESI